MKDVRTLIQRYRKAREPFASIELSPDLLKGFNSRNQELYEAMCREAGFTEVKNLPDNHVLGAGTQALFEDFKTWLEPRLQKLESASNI